MLLFFSRPGEISFQSAGLDGADDLSDGGPVYGPFDVFDGVVDEVSQIIPEMRVHYI